MEETQSSLPISTRLERIAEAARQNPERAFTTLAHHIDLAWLREAYQRTSKDGAPGIDGQTAEQYATKLEENLQSLLDRFKSGRYRAPAVRRVHIPKGDGKRTRPIGVPTFEDKVLQRAVAMVLEAIYEQDFLPCSYGFRPGRSAHQALEAVRDATMPVGGGWVVEVDIEACFDTLNREVLQEMVRRRVRDGVLLRMIGKWLNAGVQEQGSLTNSESGTPQGGVISPLLMNVYLNEVVDQWFENQVRPRMRGRCRLVRYADDMVLAFEREEDARRVLEVLPKRFGRYSLALHPEKTRLVDFRRPGRGRQPGSKPQTFDFLGFTHYWGKTRRGANAVKQKTAKDRLSRTLRRIRQWCREHRHAPLRAQQQALARKLRGHYGYFGIAWNYPALEKFYKGVQAAWRKWLSRRSDTAWISWEKMLRLLERFPLPKPRIVHPCPT
jgi:group II intron reverse transcriptase/maturase